MNKTKPDYEKRIAGFLAFPAILLWPIVLSGFFVGLGYENYALAIFLVFGSVIHTGWFLRIYRKNKERKNRWFIFWFFSALSGLLGIAYTLSSDDFSNVAVYAFTPWWAYTTIMSILAMMTNMQNKSVDTTRVSARRFSKTKGASNLNPTFEP